MFLKLLLGVIVLIAIGIFMNIDFNKVVVYLLYASMATFLLIFCWVHPLVGVTAVVSILILAIVYSYEAERPSAHVKSNAIVYICILLGSLSVVIEVIETFTGRLF